MNICGRNRKLKGKNARKLYTRTLGGYSLICILMLILTEAYCRECHEAATLYQGAFVED